MRRGTLCCTTSPRSTCDTVRDPPRAEATRQSGHAALTSHGRRVHGREGIRGDPGLVAPGTCKCERSQSPHSGCHVATTVACLPALRAHWQATARTTPANALMKSSAPDAAPIFPSPPIFHSRVSIPVLGTTQRAVPDFAACWRTQSGRQEHQGDRTLDLPLLKKVTSSGDAWGGSKASAVRGRLARATSGPGTCPKPPPLRTALAGLPPASLCTSGVASSQVSAHQDRAHEESI